MRSTLKKPSFRRAMASATIAFAVQIVLAGCASIPGRPGPGPQVMRPEAELSFAALYKDNCAGCHGANGKDGAAISLSNPVFVEFAKDHLHDIIAGGVHGTLMPAFGSHAGGMLTDRQVDVLTQGIVTQWGNANALSGAHFPQYLSASKGDVARGQAAYGTFCARCHGANGEGAQMDAKTNVGDSGSVKTGSIVDPSYLALVSDQNLRNVAIAGRPDQGMPDWRSDAAQAMTDQQIDDIVAWMASKRVANPGQPYSTHP